MAQTTFRIEAWHGSDVERRVMEASAKGIDDTMAACANSAKNDHPGWNNITGTAEGSIAILQPARKSGNAIAGIWGSMGVRYMIFLEILHGAALRGAADRNYPSLKKRIQAHLR